MERARRQTRFGAGFLSPKVALFTWRIATRPEHFETHRTDNQGCRRLLKMVAQRRKRLDHLKGKDEARYQNLIKRLGIRR